ncbi:hypothetical protein NDN08_007831 [Rhodosorus marinus]|uniref:Uncharacterized protein n=1 Tax=Rhodosorus marinus TaxID=101924 RepID=A0AAV8UYP5_9RHOD|nr:hypothetical protein NDN08_007831 [Rhodosorus marinus]
MDTGAVVNLLDPSVQQAAGLKEETKRKRLSSVFGDDREVSGKRCEDRMPPEVGEHDVFPHYATGWCEGDLGIAVANSESGSGTCSTTHGNRLHPGRR